MGESREQVDRPSRRPYHHGDLRNTLLLAGAELLAREGVQGVDLRKLARQAGVSHAAPYRHFPDKQALLAALAEEGFDELVRRVATAVEDAGDDVAGQLDAAGYAYVLFAQERPEHLQLMFSGLAGERAPDSSLFRAYKAGLYLLIGIIERGQQAGTVVAGDSTKLAVATWATMHGLAILIMEQQIPPVVGDPEAAAGLTRSVLRTLFDGLASR